VRRWVLNFHLLEPRCVFILEMLFVTIHFSESFERKEGINLLFFYSYIIYKRTLFCLFAVFFGHLVKAIFFLFYKVGTIKRNKLRVCKHIFCSNLKQLQLLSQFYIFHNYF
jgi:hypothetical protein